LSVVELPPKVPHPSVRDGTRPVVTPKTPCAPGELTRIRLVGIAAPKRVIRSGSALCTIDVWPLPMKPSRRRENAIASSSPETSNSDSTGVIFSPASGSSSPSQVAGTTITLISNGRLMPVNPAIVAAD
jgi:hypothetical protein